MSSQDNPPARLADDTETLRRENERLTAELERTNKERIEYLQNVSHQLVAPLNAIKWHIENLTNNRVGVERAKRVLRSIYSQSTIAVHLAKNFALMSNLEGDHSLAALREPLQEVNLRTLLINLADDFQPLGWDKELRVSVADASSSGDLPTVLAMKPLLSQAFSNIIENAVKYSDRMAEVTIEVSAIDTRGEEVLATVTSKGIPLPEKDQSVVFERGYRTQEARNQYPAGTGFGLYIAKRIVEIHEGAISAETDSRGRVVFKVVLPARALEGKTRQRA